MWRHQDVVNFDQLTPDLCFYKFNIREDTLTFDFILWNHHFADFVNVWEWKLKVKVDRVTSDLFELLIQGCLVIFGLLRDNFDVDQVAILLIMLEIFTVYIHQSIVVWVIFILVLYLVSDTKGFLSNDFFHAELGFLIILINLWKLQTRQLWVFLCCVEDVFTHYLCVYFTLLIKLVIIEHLLCP